MPGSFDEHASGNHFMFRLLGVEAITVVPGRSDMGAAMQQVADALRAEHRLGCVIPGGGSNALGGLGYVACAQEMQQQPKYSVPNPGMVEAVQMLARTEGILLDPACTGKVAAGMIGMARAGMLKAGERVLFLHTGGLPSLHAYERVVLGR